jgi:hypothetical protein
MMSQVARISRTSGDCFIAKVWHDEHQTILRQNGKFERWDGRRPAPVWRFETELEVMAACLNAGAIPMFREEGDDAR